MLTSEEVLDHSPHMAVFTEASRTALSGWGVAEVAGAGQDRTHLPYAESSPSLKQQQNTPYIAGPSSRLQLEKVIGDK